MGPANLIPPDGITHDAQVTSIRGLAGGLVLAFSSGVEVAWRQVTFFMNSCHLLSVYHRTGIVQSALHEFF